MLDALTAACTDAETLTAPQAKDLLKHALACARYTKRVVPDHTAVRAAWDPPSWEGLATTLAASERFKASTGLQSMCRQIVALASKEGSVGAAGKAQKRKAGDAMDVDAPAEGQDGGEDVEATKKPKRKKQKATKSS